MQMFILLLPLFSIVLHVPGRDVVAAGSEIAVGPHFQQNA
jgi:hypothetical protein